VADDPTPEEQLEALMAVAAMPPETREKLGPTDEEARRLLAAGYELTHNVWKETVAIPPGGFAYQSVRSALAELDLLGEDGPAAVDAVLRLEGKEAALRFREELLRRAEE
jgi:hypothetical protein